MTQQPELLPARCATSGEWPPRSHSDDPDTSHRAESIVRNSGKMRDHAGAVYATVKASGPVRGSDVAGLLKGHPLFASDPHERLYQVRRRLSDLHTVHHLIRPVKTHGVREALWRVSR